MICPPHEPAPLVLKWLSRHRNPTSLVLHLIGMPPTVMAVLILPASMFLLSWPIFLFAMGLFVGGFLIQFLGHALEGSVPGELTLIGHGLARLRPTGLTSPAPTPSQGRVA